MTPDEEMDFAEQWKAAVSRLYDFALTDIGKKRGGFSPVSDELAARILAELRVDVTGYRHMIDADGIRHIHKQHGGSKEFLRGQVPIVKEDILRLRMIVTKPERISLAETGRHGLTRIEMTKAISGYVYTCIVELQKGREWVVPVTLYKRTKI